MHWMHVLGCTCNKMALSFRGVGEGEMAMEGYIKGLQPTNIIPYLDASTVNENTKIRASWLAKRRENLWRLFILNAEEKY